jgi:hypothetical protein
VQMRSVAASACHLQGTARIARNSGRVSAASSDCRPKKQGIDRSFRNAAATRVAWLLQVLGSVPSSNAS